MRANQTEDVLRALLDTEIKPEKDVFMKRFGVNFRIQAIDGKLINRIREQASYPTKNGKQLEEDKFSALIIAKACIIPDFLDKNILDKFGPTPADAAMNRLLAGEIAKLSSEILDLSGFGDEDEAIDEIKN